MATKENMMNNDSKMKTEETTLQEENESLRAQLTEARKWIKWVLGELPNMDGCDEEYNEAVRTIREELETTL